MFENRVLKRIFGPKREDVAGGWRILHIFYHSRSIISVRVKEDVMYMACTRGIQMFPDWPPGARTANGTALCH
jgi:hypothetical protein